MMDLKILDSDGPEPLSECCQKPLVFVDADAEWTPPIVIDGLRGVGWFYEKWNCSSCARRSHALVLTLATPAEDDHVIWDGFHTAETSHIVTLTDNGVTVLGEEAFRVSHENPVANFVARSYDMMGEYTFGPFLDKDNVVKVVHHMMPLLVERVQAYRHPK
jgi:hypothetical protein